MFVLPLFSKASLLLSSSRLLLLLAQRTAWSAFPVSGALLLVAWLTLLYFSSCHYLAPFLDSFIFWRAARPGRRSWWFFLWTKWCFGLMRWSCFCCFFGLLDATVVVPGLVFGRGRAALMNVDKGGRRGKSRREHNVMSSGAFSYCLYPCGVYVSSTRAYGWGRNLFLQKSLYIHLYRLFLVWSTHAWHVISGIGTKCRICRGSNVQGSEPCKRRRPECRGNPSE